MSGANRRGRSRWWLLATAAAVIVLVASVVLVLRGGTRHAPDQATGPSATTGATGSSSAATPAGPVPSTTESPTTTRTTPPRTTAPRSTTAGPEPGMPPQLRGQDVTVLPTSRRVVALTFDAGGDAAGLDRILATLADRHVHATFFLTGRWVQAYPGAVARIRAAGHRVGNHTVSHPHMTGLDTTGIRNEVLGAQQTIIAAGADPRPLFRFPFGERDQRTISVVNDLGYVSVRWTVDTLGWEGTAGGMSAQKVADRAVGALRPGEIVLMHVGANPDDHTTFDADALPATIDRMRASGYDFVTLDALLA